jgi:hypothetical protein
MSAKREIKERGSKKFKPPFDKPEEAAPTRD